MYDVDWNEKAKCLLKAELIKRGINSEDLVNLLEEIGVQETKAGIDSKISRGTFSAAFLIQCLNAIRCKNFIPEVEQGMILSEPVVLYRRTKKSTQKIK
jgi:Domain of unknown function (DUF6471)